MNPGPLISSAGSLAGHFFDGPFPDLRNMPPGPGVYLVTHGMMGDFRVGNCAHQDDANMRMPPLHFF